jgi:hypothetical protein
MDEDNKDSKEDKVITDTQEVVFKYVKSNFYRVIHANGAFGGISGRGEIHIGFYSERIEFPDSSRMTISSAGHVSPEQFEGSRQPVREIEADIVVDLETARLIRLWLDGKIAFMEKLIKQAEQETVSHGNEITIPKA